MAKGENKKSGKTTVETAKIQEILGEKLGLSSEPKAGWINYFVAVAGSDKRNSKRILVHTGKKGTNCIELVGFELEHEGIVVHPCPPAKTMTQMVDCNLEESLIKRAVYAAGKRLVEIAAEEAAEAEKAAAEAAAKAEQEKAQAAAEPVAEAATANG